MARAEVFDAMAKINAELVKAERLSPEALVAAGVDLEDVATWFASSVVLIAMLVPKLDDIEERLWVGEALLRTADTAKRYGVDVSEMFELPVLKELSDDIARHNGELL